MIQSQQNMFFIVGRPRSGTTLLLTILDANPHVLIPVEWPIIIKLLPKYSHIRYFSKDLLIQFCKDIENTKFHQHYGFYDMSFDHQKALNEIKSCNPATKFEDLIKILYSNYKSIFEKDEILCVGDKNPLASKEINKLLQSFTNAKFIHIVRDYRDHAVSMINAGFGQKNLPLIVYRWQKYQAILDKAYYQNSNRFLRLRYEDLIDNPEKWVKIICEFLNIPYLPQMLEYYKNDLSSMYPKELALQYQNSLLQPINKTRSGIWKNEFNNKQLKIIDYLAGRQAELWGYQRVFKTFSLKGLLLKNYFRIRGLIVHFKK